jgi:hypothetical protein
MTTTPVPVPEAPAAISPWGRVLGIFFSPKAIFEDIVRKPSWVLPVILVTVLSCIAIIALNQRMNWREYVGEKFEKDPRASQLSVEQKQQQIEVAVKITVVITYVVGVLGPVVSALLVAAVMWGAYNLLSGAGASFSSSFAITAHAFLVGLVSTPIFLLVLFLKPPGTLDPENPMATNVAAILPEESAKWLVTLGRQLDIFSIWMLILLAIGFAAVNPKKLKGSKSYTIAFTVWATYVVIRVGWAFIFS